MAALSGGGGGAVEYVGQVVASSVGSVYFENLGDYDFVKIVGRAVTLNASYSYIYFLNSSGVQLGSGYKGSVLETVGESTSSYSWTTLNAIQFYGRITYGQMDIEFSPPKSGLFAKGGSGSCIAFAAGAYGANTYGIKLYSTSPISGVFDVWGYKNG